MKKKNPFKNQLWSNWLFSQFNSNFKSVLKSLLRLRDHSVTAFLGATEVRKKRTWTQTAQRLQDLLALTFRYMSVIEYFMSGKHGLEITVGGSEERKTLPGWTAGRDCRWKETGAGSICRHLVWGRGHLPNELLSKRGLTGTHGARWRRKEKTHSHA